MSIMGLDAKNQEKIGHSIVLRPISSLKYRDRSLTPKQLEDNLYFQFIFPRFPKDLPLPDFLDSAFPLLLEFMAPKAALRMSERYAEAQHCHNAEVLFEHRMESYRHMMRCKKQQQFPPAFRKRLRSLKSKILKTAFTLCYHLSQYADKFPIGIPGVFYLSARDLRDRLMIRHHSRSHRILRKLETLGHIRTVKTGVQHPDSRYRVASLFAMCE